MPGKPSADLAPGDSEQHARASWPEVRLKTRCAVVIEKAHSNYSAYVPDLPGCVATGASLEEVEREIREAIAFHLDGMREVALPIPAPTSKVEYIELAG